MIKRNRFYNENGYVGVAYSPGYGAGWVTWNDGLDSFNPKVIQMILDDKQNEITTEWCKENLGNKNIYCGGAKDLKICWLPEGTQFDIEEYAGFESIKILQDLCWVA